jgi:peptidoglycan/LPS O-acetylase OafA/YrhL
VFTVLGDHIKGYHLLDVLWLIADGVLLFLLLRRCRMRWTLAVAACAAFLVFPGSDATRLWPTASGAQYILATYLVGVLAAMAALRRTGWRSAALHVVSYALFLAMAFTYEVVLPPIAMNGLFYVLAFGPRRRVLVRSAGDLAFAAAFSGYRMLLAPADSTSGFDVARTTGQWVDRVWSLVKGMWTSWKALYAPTTLAVVLILAGLALVLVTARRRAELRPELARWAGVALAAAAFAVVSMMAYAPANNLYVPQVGGTFNRLNLAAAPAYAVLAVAGGRLLYVSLRAWLSWRTSAEVVTALALLLAAGQVRVERASQNAWAQSWRQQTTALNAIKRMTPGIPRDASIVSFGHPIWEAGYVPVFSASWDLRGAIDAETPIDPPAATPYVPGVSCGPQAVQFDGRDYMPYHGASPVWFFDVKSYGTAHVTSQQQCVAAANRFGVPPYFDPVTAG